MIFARAIPPQCSRTYRTRRRSCAPFWRSDVLEVELKSVVEDTAGRRGALERAGGVLLFAGRLEARRYDFDDRPLTMRDHGRRGRIHRDEHPPPAQLGW